MAGMNSGTTSWGVAITLIVFAVLVDVANYAYVTQGSSFGVNQTNYSYYNSSSTATSDTNGVGYINSLSNLQVSHDLPGWMQISIYIVNAMILVIVYMLLRGIW